MSRVPIVPFLALALFVGASGCSDDKAKSTGGAAATSTATVTPPKKKPAEEEKLYPPCHPGCFPAGTTIETPTGVRSIETIKVGDLVTLVNEQGKGVIGPVNSVFKTTSRLFEVQTESGSFRTTNLQPLCLADGGFQTAGNLKPGDTIWRWVDGQRQKVGVKSVESTGQDAAVFNLVVGESAVFIAGGFLAKGKPPATGE